MTRPIFKTLRDTVFGLLMGLPVAFPASAGGSWALRTNFQNVVPNAIHTVWYCLQAIPATDPFTTYGLPFGKRDGSEAIFESDTDGHATYDASFKPCPQLNGNQLDAALRYRLPERRQDVWSELRRTWSQFPHSAVHRPKR